MTGQNGTGLAPKAQHIVEAAESLTYIHALLAQSSREFEVQVGVPTCVEGCGVCCLVNTPPAIRLEAFNLRQVLLTLPPARREDIIQRALGWLTREEPGLTTVQAAQHNIDFAKLSAAERAALLQEGGVIQRGACPFLDWTTRGCTVYEARPLACRAYGSTLAADPYCQRPRGAMETEELTAAVDEQHPIAHTIKAAVQTVMDGLAQHLPELHVTALWPFLVLAELAPDRLKKALAEHPVAMMKLTTGHARTYQGAMFTSQQPRTVRVQELSPQGQQWAYELMEKRGVRPQEAEEFLHDQPRGPFLTRVERPVERNKGGRKP